MILGILVGEGSISMNCGCTVSSGFESVTNIRKCCSMRRLSRRQAQSSD